MAAWWGWPWAMLLGIQAGLGWLPRLASFWVSRSDNIKSPLYWLLSREVLWHSLEVISQEVHKLLFCIMMWKITFLTHLPLVPMRRWTWSSLVQVMACPLFSAKPLPEPMLVYCQLDSWEQVSVNFESEFYHFHSRKCIWKCCLPKWRPFCPGEMELILLPHHPGANAHELMIPGCCTPTWDYNMYIV